MENTVYAIRCVCLCILCSGGHTGFVSLFIQNKKRERSEIIDRAKRRRTKQAARETSTLLWGKEKSKRTKKIIQKRIFYIFFAKNLFMSKKSSIFAPEISKSFPFMGKQSKNTILC